MVMVLERAIQLCVTTYKWESEDTSLKMPSGSSEISLPWRDLKGEGEGEDKKRKYMKTSEHRKKIILLEQSSKEDLLIGQLPENQLVFDLLKHISIIFKKKTSIWMNCPISVFITVLLCPNGKAIFFSK